MKVGLIPLGDLTPLWTTSRASGIAALLCASLSIVAGLLMALRSVALRHRRVELRAVHEALAVATFGLLAVHAVSLFFDPVLRPGLAGILVPFAAGYERIGSALGQLAANGMLGLGLTFYLRRHIGSQRRRRAHRAIPVFWLLAVGHGLLIGTDAGSWWFVLVLAGPVLASTGLLAQRLAQPRPMKRSA